VEEGMMRNPRIGLLEITPTIYNPVSGELLIARELRITVQLNGSGHCRHAGNWRANTVYRPSTRF
jgi:hypothetical protein